MCLITITRPRAQGSRDVPAPETTEQETTQESPVGWREKASALAMLLSIVLVAAMVGRTLPNAWAKGKRQAETDAMLRDLDGK